MMEIEHHIREKRNHGEKNIRDQNGKTWFLPYYSRLNTKALIITGIGGTQEDNDVQHQRKQWFLNLQLNQRRGVERREREGERRLCDKQGYRV